MKKIILDTDFILHSINFKIDIKENLQKICDFNFSINILDQTLNELKGKPSEKLAFQIIKLFNIIKTTQDKSVDDLLLEQENIIVATVDKDLKEKLKKRKIPIITIKQKSYYKIENVL